MYTLEKTKTVFWLLIILLIAIVITGLLAIIFYLLWFWPLFILFIILVIIFLLLLCWYRSLEDTKPAPKREPKRTTTRRTTTRRTTTRAKPKPKITGTKPVEEVEGIGQVYGGKLRRSGIKYVEQLGKASATKVASTCDVPKDTAQKWVYMARLLAVPSVGEEDAEALVLACGITTRKQLSEADPASLYRKISRAVAAGKVIVPKDYKFTRQMAETWVKDA